MVFWDKEILTIINPAFSDEEIQDELKRHKVFRKGPYRINNVSIPSQWNSFIKWKYLKDILENLIGREEVFQKKHPVILDVGANNGYYSFCIYYELKGKGIVPEITLIDPVQDFFEQFRFLEKFFPEGDRNRWSYRLAGWEDLDTFQEQYDIILLMGILYHHPVPYHLLGKVKEKLVKNGLLILETITVSYGEYPLFLLPEKRYAGATGMWFIPNRYGVEVLLRRANYREITFWSERFVPDEMRSVGYLPSLESGLQKDNPEFTIEGYPKPHRSFFTAKR